MLEKDKMGIQKNFVYSGILTVSNYVFPLIVFPYISRVLGVENVGICSFIDSIINYFIIFSMLGISAIGIRETAAARTEPSRLGKVFSSLITLNGLFTAVLLVVLLVCTQWIDRLYEHRQLMYVGAFKLLFNFLLMEWLYTGMEEFRYITERSLIVRVLYLIAVFTLVKAPTDYSVYFALTVGLVVVNALINMVRSRRIVRYRFRDVNLKKYLKPYVTLGVYMILTNLYTAFNIIFLGFASTDSEVGYFSTAYKLIIIFQAVYTAWTNVVMPRMSSLHSDNDEEQFNRLVHISMSVLLCLSVPIVIAGMIFSRDIILLVSGRCYEPAALPLRWLMPLIFIIGYSQILVMQILIPCKADRFLACVSGICAVVCILLNAWLVPRFHAMGSAVAWLSSEVCVLFIAQTYVTRRFGIRFPFRILLQNVAIYLPAVVLCLLVRHFVTDAFFLHFIVASVLLLAYFVAVQCLYLKNPFVLAKLHALHAWLFSRQKP